MIVLDASAAVELVLRLPGAGLVERELFDTENGAHAPELLYVESLHALRRYEGRGRIEPERAALAVADLLSLPLTPYAALPLIERAWQLRANFTPYDALYVVLAEAIRARLVTADAGLAASAREQVGIECVLLS